MITLQVRRYLSISLVLLISSNGIAWGTQVFADNHCDKNHDKKCNHSEKNQKSTHKGLTISLNPTSGPDATLVNVMGNGFDPYSNVVISFEGDTRAVGTSTSDGGLNITFNVPSTSSNGDHIVKASQGSNSVSKTFKVTDMANHNDTQRSKSSSETFTNTSFVAPTITLNSTADPVGASVNITGARFDPNSNVVITFNDTDITTVTSNNNGEFSANFIVPLSSSVGFVQVVATQGSNSASKTFIVTSSLAAINQPNLSNITTTNLSNITTTIPSLHNLTEKMILPDIFA